MFICQTIWHLIIWKLLNMTSLMRLAISHILSQILYIVKLKWYIFFFYSYIEQCLTLGSVLLFSQYSWQYLLQYYRYTSKIVNFFEINRNTGIQYWSNFLPVLRSPCKYRRSKSAQHYINMSYLTTTEHLCDLLDTAF